jgi:hypothetical protein
MKLRAKPVVKTLSKMDLQTQSILSCPASAFQKEETMPENSCQFFSDVETARRC